MIKSLRLTFLCLSIFLLFSTLTLANSIGYHAIQIPGANETTITTLQRGGISFEGSFYKKDVVLNIIVDDIEREFLKRNNIGHHVLIRDVEDHYADRLDRSQTLHDVPLSAPSNFAYGTMGGFLTYKEIEDTLDRMLELFPNLITEKERIGKSVEGRDIWAVTIASQLDKKDDLLDNRPKVLYTALHHAREPQGMMTVVYFMWHLLENYETSERTRSILDTRKLYFVPIVNPDGYVYNQTQRPNGGGMWRKNRQVESGRAVGVDLNRNYGYKWGYDNTGSSANPGSQTYRGLAPFSEPETQSIRLYCQEHKFDAALNYHSYGNLLIHPYGFSDTPTEDHELFKAIGHEMIKENHYKFGTGSDTVGYTVNGDSDDWMYASNEADKIFAMTPEVGQWGDGFWPSKDRIVPLAEINLNANYYLAEASGTILNFIDEDVLLSQATTK